MVDAAVLQHQLEIGLVKGALSRLVDHRLPGRGIKFGDDVVPGLAPHENAPHRARSADAQRRIAALDFHRRGIGEIRPVAFPRMDDEDTGAPRSRQHVRARSDSRLEPGHVVAERGAEPAGLQKIPLHVDNKQRRPAGFDRNRRRLRFYRPYCHGTFRLPDRVAFLG